jgi:dGTPase
VIGRYDSAARSRWITERPKSTPDGRPAFNRDRARVLHSSALRRLAAKTQVVGPTDDDFPRTRLTHSLECAQIGRSLAQALGADPDLVDAACLAHDLGHPPFGHNGESALAEAAAVCGGFEGNAQSLRELTRLEIKAVGPDGRSVGLNLTRATLDAAVKYPWPRTADQVKFGVYDDDLPVFGWLRAGAPGGRRPLETQIMDWADDVAYSVHDLEDGLYTGLVDLARLDDRALRADLSAETAVRYPPGPAGALDEALDRLRAEPWWLRGTVAAPAGVVALRRMTSELIARFCAAATRATRARFGPGPLFRYEADLVVPPGVAAECAALKGVTARFVMGRDGADARQRRQRDVVAELVDRLWEVAPAGLDPLLRPAFAAAPDDAARMRVVIDQVARLTDTSAQRRHAELTGSAWIPAL